jgi:ribosomal protein S16
VSLAHFPSYGENRQVQIPRVTRHFTILVAESEAGDDGDVVELLGWTGPLVRDIEKRFRIAPAED